MLRTVFYLAITILIGQVGMSQCVVQQAVPLSSRNASYNIDVRLDTESKTITGQQSLEWINPSNDTLFELRFYMYTNAFKNSESTFLKGASNLFGRDYSDRPEAAWGSIEVGSIVDQSGNELVTSAKYIQPDDGNPEDETVLLVALSEPVLPKDTIQLEMDFVTKLPELLVRIGYSRDDFYHVTHWFPQVGVYEQDTSNNWSWNCHQFHRGTEFFSDFGNYKVSIELPEHLMVEASGCRIVDEPTEAGWRRVTYAVEDVIDFAWVAYPHFRRFEDSWNGIEIRLLTATEHDILAPRFFEAVKASLAYLEEHVGPYPYPSIAMMDPPIHALSSGFMEYPTYITLGSFRYFPKGVRTIESLVMHEFTHQYFMGMLASNEKEEAWLDEGFVTYFEDRTMEATYGDDGSMISLLGMHINSSDFTRSEYIDLPDPSVGPVARPGWEITEGYKGLVYSKTATVLKTLEGMVSRPVMDKIIKSYFQKWKFKHPNGHDFIRIVKDVLEDEGIPNIIGNVDRFFDQLIYGVGVCDYAVTGIENLRPHTKVGLFGQAENGQFFKTTEAGLRGRVELRRLGGVILPVEVLVTMLDGTKETFVWDGEEALMFKEFSKEVVSCEIDPHQKLMVDIDRLNNSYTTQPDPWPVRKVGVKAIFWIQNLLQSFSFLV